MELENRSMKMFLQTMPKKGIIFTFITFSLLFSVCIIIGIFGPAVYEIRQVSSYNCPPGVVNWNPVLCPGGVNLAQNNSVWNGIILNLDKLNQELYLITTIENKFRLNVDQDLEFQISIEGRNRGSESWISLLANDSHSRKVICKQDQAYCSNITLIHQRFIQYSSYKFGVSILNNENQLYFLGDVLFTFNFVNQTYTLFELWFRFIFLLFNFMFIMIFSYFLRSYNWSSWTIEQKWACILLFALIAYNNPFFALEMIANNWFPIFLNRILHVSFISILFFFWLAIFDGIRYESTNINSLGFYLPKIFLIVAFYFSLITILTWSDFHQIDDPVYQSSLDLPGFLFFQIFILLIVVIYLVWLLFTVIKTCYDLKTMPYLGIRIKFFGLFTLVVMLGSIVGLFYSVFGGRRTNVALQFVSFLALFNFYCFTLAFMYLPAARSGRTTSKNFNKIGMIRLENEPEDLTKENETSIELEDLQETK